MKINVSKNVTKYLGLKEVREKFDSDVVYEATGEQIKDCAQGLFEAGKLKGWLYGAGTVFIAWAACEAIDWLDQKFKKES